MIVLAATGLQGEARLLQRYGIIAIAGGGDSQALKRHLVEQMDGVCLLLSTGLGGALNPQLRVGDVVLDGGTAPQPLIARLTRQAPSVKIGKVIGSDAPVTTSDAKSELRAESGADVIDMETQVVARVAAARGIPFIAIRAISDAATHHIPSAALVGMKSDGSVDPLAVMRALVAQPNDLPTLLMTAMRPATAMRALGRVYRCLDLVGNLREHFINMV